MQNNNFIALNQFNGGVNTDLDEHRLTNNQCEYLLNGEILDFQGNIGVLTNKNGNKFEFSITDGFKPFAYEVIKGVAFILSHNSITGEGEIGCYPAPLAYTTQNVNAIGYTRAYSPLWNFCTANDQYTTQASRTFLRTNNFNFQLSKIYSVRCREDYDQTINIYFCDGVNTDKVINSGFHISTASVITKRTYGLNSFPNFVELINESPFHPTITSPNIISGGRLKNGNWKIFARYTSYDYNPTSFLSETNMLMVSDINLTDTIAATGEMPGHITNKAISLVLTNCDSAYKFIEIGFVHYFGDTYESGIVDKRFEITTGSCPILFTGAEPIISTDLSSIIVKKTTNKISESITALDGRLFRSNLKRNYKIDDILKTFALAITGEEDYVGLSNAPFYENLSVSSNGMYKNWQNVYYYTGYWTGEAYPFGIVYVFNDGTETETYPIAGIDYFNNALTPNTNGVIRFPDHSNRDKPIYDNETTSPATKNSYVMGIKFDMTAANSIFTGSSYLQQNIKGFYIVRGERKKNIIYQGFITDTYTSTIDEDKFYGDYITNALALFSADSVGSHTYIGTNYHMPMIEKNGEDTDSFSPQIMYFINDKDSVFWGLGVNNTLKAYDPTPINKSVSIVQRSLYRKALFSADHFFLKSLPKQHYILQSIGKITLLSTFDDAPSIFRQIKNSYFFQDENYLQSLDFRPYAVDCIQQSPWNSIPLNGFVSMFNEGSLTDPTSFAAADAQYNFMLGVLKDTFSVVTLAIGGNSYIGIKTPFSGDTSGPGDGDDGSYAFLNSIANLYIDEPTNITIANIYDPKNTFYSKISPLLPISSTGINGAYFNGDCFLQRVCQRVTQNPSKYPTSYKRDSITSSWVAGLFQFQFNADFDVNRSGYITTGQIIEYVSEQNLNHCMRLVDGNKSFYPSSTVEITNPLIETGYTEYAVNNLLPESDNFNRGFSATFSLMQYLGYNTDLPNRLSEFPNRIMGSNNHILNGFKDGYRNFGLATFQDYNYGYGKITDIQTLLGQLVCIMEHHIGLIPVNERAQIGTSSGELLIGLGDLLPLKQQELSQRVGCQQKSTIVNSGNAIYGWDWQLRKIWQATTSAGIQYISDTRGISKWLNKLINDSTLGYSDVLQQGLESIIRVGFDQEYADIIWSIIIEDTTETICYSEKLNLFKGWYSFVTPFYMTINEDFYSTNPNSVKEFWLHDDETNKNNFYGTQYNTKATFIINEKADIAKIFDNIIINSNGEEFLRLDYETLTQLSSHTPFIKTNPLDKWIQPKYKNDKWFIPLNRTEVVKPMVNGTNLIKSKLRGNWLRITLEFNKNTPIFIKSIMTHYNISNH